MYSDEIDVYRNPTVLPRAYVIRSGTMEPLDADILEYRPDEVVIRAEGPGLLVLADSWDPGWRTEGFTIASYEGLLRSVSLPQGSHTVRFVYSPWH